MLPEQLEKQVELAKTELIKYLGLIYAEKRRVQEESLELFEVWDSLPWYRFIRRKTIELESGICVDTQLELLVLWIDGSRAYDSIGRVPNADVVELLHRLRREPPNHFCRTIYPPEFNVHLDAAIAHLGSEVKE